MNYFILNKLYKWFTTRVESPYTINIHKVSAVDMVFLTANIDGEHWAICGYLFFASVEIRISTKVTRASEYGKAIKLLPRSLFLVQNHFSVSLYNGYKEDIFYPQQWTTIKLKAVSNYYFTKNIIILDVNLRF